MRGSSSIARQIRPEKYLNNLVKRRAHCRWKCAEGDMSKIHYRKIIKALYCRVNSGLIDSLLIPPQLSVFFILPRFEHNAVFNKGVLGITEDIY